MMPNLLVLKTLTDSRGCLTVVEKGVPFPIKRVFYTYRVPAGAVRGRHAHRRTRIALVAMAGSCEVSGCGLDGESWRFLLTNPTECLVLEPGDWHQMAFLEAGTILLCLASEEFDPEDYVYDHPDGNGGSVAG